jgi:hypothetical protein
MFAGLFDNGQWTMDNGQWTLANGQWTWTIWTMDNGQLDNGQWTMDNGQWTMDNGQWTMDNGHSPFTISQLNCNDYKTMKVIESYRQAKETLISFEILPALKGKTINSIYENLDPLMEVQAFVY